MTEFLYLFALLLFGHALADYPLQGDFLARAKNHTAPIPGVPWQWALFMHVVIHSGVVLIITGSGLLAIFELFAHATIDYAKNEGLLEVKDWEQVKDSPAGYRPWSAFTIDQLLHIGCKLLWALLAVTIVWN